MNDKAPSLWSRVSSAARRLLSRRGQGDGIDPVPRLGVSPRFLIILVAVTVAAGATDVWLSRRPRQPPMPTSRPGTPVPSTPEPLVAPPDPHLEVVAEASVPRVPIYEDPEDRRPRRRLASPTENGVPLVFLVTEDEGEWLQVLLPVRPNGSTGWIRRQDVTISQHRFRVAVFLNAHRLVAFEGGELLLRAKVAIGTKDTPTPGGSYYIKELLKPPNPNTVYGTYAYGLSGYSNVLRSFGGGKGVIGIHGTNDPSVLGSDVSAGCIRMRNRDIEKLVRVLPLGTPVEIIR